MYRGLPFENRESGLFLVPVYGEKVDFSSGMFQTGGRRYLPGFQPLGVNLMRKMMHVGVLFVFHGAENLADIKAADKHSEKTALDNYCALEFQQQANAGTRVYWKAMGAPPDWPTELEIADVERVDQQDRDGCGVAVGEGGPVADEEGNGADEEGHCSGEDADGGDDCGEVAESESGDAELEQHLSLIIDGDAVDGTAAIAEDSDPTLKLLIDLDPDAGDTGSTGAGSSDGTGARRAYSYDSNTARFNKKDVAHPNILAHVPQPAKLQTLLQIGQAPPTPPPAHSGPPGELGMPASKKARTTVAHTMAGSGAQGGAGAIGATPPATLQLKDRRFTGSQEQYFIAANVALEKAKVVHMGALRHILGEAVVAGIIEDPCKNITDPTLKKAATNKVVDSMRSFLTRYFKK